MMRCQTCLHPNMTATYTYSHDDAARVPLAAQTQHGAVPDEASNALQEDPATGSDITLLHQGAEAAETMLAL